MNVNVRSALRWGRNIHYVTYRVRREIYYSLKSWWGIHRPVSWWDMISSFVLIGITLGFLITLVVLGFYRFMATSCS